ncbi:hypothetical protein FB565_005397 [Actinoplanes lutulentus]|uniref:IPT/TIG domain-containing protein n=1 Tax=Actinoplanes lutulentus TaxID=1287878 RepID=A0A327YZV6_9ACTN|nr:hypothetical protein [Actinoplanes lutulentus]MBB2945639.1 hypothetical protein [Actinoplanes lutulentus]RAK27236.1 hypothetical protein B0I29_124124 [Actinoplanes lutulentus]
MPTDKVAPTEKVAPAEELAPAEKSAAGCGGELVLGSPVSCAVISGQERHTYTVRTTVDGERLLTNFVSGGNDAQATLILSDGGTCYVGAYSDGCQAPQAGVHTIEVFLNYSEGSTSYALGVESQTNPSKCVTVDSFAANGPKLSGKLPRGAAGDCYRIDGKAGMRLTAEMTQTAADGNTNLADVRGWMQNPAGERICPIQFGGGECTLETDGEYRVFLADNYAGATDYTFRLVRTDVVTGCDSLREAGFGALSAGQSASGAIPTGEYRCYAVDLSSGLKFVQFRDGGQILWDLTGTNGSVCGKYSTEYRPCEVAAGAYTLWLRNQDWTFDPVAFSVSIADLGATEGCAAQSGTQWNQPAQVVTPASPVEFWCQPFTAAAGERVRAYVSGGGLSWITDATGARICDGQDSSQDGCLLPGSGPYRLIGEVDGDDEVKLQIRSLSAPAGCPVITPGAYGSAPAGAFSGNRCRVLSVPAAGRHLVRVVDGESYEPWAQIYNAAGLKACSAGYLCNFPAAGEYTLVIGSGVEESQYATVFTAPNGPGCLPVSDQGLADAAYRGSLSVAGETDCLELRDSVAGATIDVLLPTRAADAARPGWTLINGAGENLCETNSCKLAGPAPYRILLSSSEGVAAGEYALIVQRTDRITGCAALPLGAIGDNSGVTTAFSADRFATCYTIPAGQHATSEIFSHLPVNGGTGTAVFTVLDETGRVVCGSEWDVTYQLIHCGLTTGKAYTAVLVAQPANVQYRVSRRDASPAGAKCQAPASTVLGGPGAAGTLTGAGDVRCYRVSTSASAVFWLGLRSTDHTARYRITDAAGKALCDGFVYPCRVSGSTSYQVFVRPVAGRASVPYRFDAWNLGTKDKPAAQCEKAYGAPGFGTLTGTLGDQRTAICVAVPVKNRSEFLVRLTNTAGRAEIPESYYFRLGGPVDWTSPCSWSSRGGQDCEVSLPSSEPTGIALFVLAPETPGGTFPFKADTTCYYEPCTIPYVLGSVSPNSALNSGPVNLSLRGNAFSATDTVTLTRSGSASIKAAVRSFVNGTLTVTADVTNAAAGAWNVTIRSAKDGRQATIAGAVTVRATALKLTKAPSISGTVRVGSTVKAVAGSWSPAATGYAYQWSANGVAIKGAVGYAYQIPAAQRGKRLTVTVTAKRANRVNSPAVSAGVTVGWGIAPAATMKPKITGTVKVGKTVKAAAGAWSPSASSYRYEWRLNGKVIKGATASKLKLKKAWKGKKLTVVVIAKRAGHYDGKATSKALKIK